MKYFFIIIITIGFIACGPPPPPDHPIEKCQTFIDRCNSMNNKPMFEGYVSLCQLIVPMGELAKQDGTAEFISYIDDVAEVRFISEGEFMQIDTTYRYFANCFLGSDGPQPPISDELTLGLLFEPNLSRGGHYFEYSWFTPVIKLHYGQEVCDTASINTSFRGTLVN